MLPTNQKYLNFTGTWVTRGGQKVIITKARITQNADDHTKDNFKGRVLEPYMSPENSETWDYAGNHTADQTLDLMERISSKATRHGG